LIGSYSAGAVDIERERRRRARARVTVGAASPSRPLDHSAGPRPRSTADANATAARPRSPSRSPPPSRDDHRADHQRKPPSVIAVAAIAPTIQRDNPRRGSGERQRVRRDRVDESSSAGSRSACIRVVDSLSGERRFGRSAASIASTCSSARGRRNGAARARSSNRLG